MSMLNSAFLLFLIPIDYILKTSATISDLVFTKAPGFISFNAY